MQTITPERSVQINGGQESGVSNGAEVMLVDFATRSVNPHPSEFVTRRLAQIQRSMALAQAEQGSSIATPTESGAELIPFSPPSQTTAEKALSFVGNLIGRPANRPGEHLRARIARKSAAIAPIIA